MQTIEYTIVPVSSLKGDNVVHRSANTSWYSGQTLNELLHKEKRSSIEELPLRFDVQNVYHSQENGFVDYRGFAGRVISGNVNVGDRIVALPSKKESMVTEIRRYTELLDTAQAGDSVSISLADEIDISRGVVLTSPNSPPIETNAVSATLVWMDEKEGIPGAKYLLKAGSREFAVKLQAIHSKIDSTQANQSYDVDVIQINDITTVDLRLSQPAFLDAYEDNKNNGVFILIDPQSNNTVAVGFIKK